MDVSSMGGIYAAVHCESHKFMKFELYTSYLDFVFVDEDGNNQWPEGLKFLFDSVSSQNMGLREAALHIFWYIICFSILKTLLSLTSCFSLEVLSYSFLSFVFVLEPV